MAYKITMHTSCNKENLCMYIYHDSGRNQTNSYVTSRYRLKTHWVTINYKYKRNSLQTVPINVCYRFACVSQFTNIHTCAVHTCARLVYSNVTSVDWLCSAVALRVWKKWVWEYGGRGIWKWKQNGDLCGFVFENNCLLFTLFRFLMALNLSFRYVVCMH